MTNNNCYLFVYMFTLGKYFLCPKCKFQLEICFSLAFGREVSLIEGLGTKA